MTHIEIMTFFVLFTGILGVLFQGHTTKRSRRNGLGAVPVRVPVRSGRSHLRSRRSSGW